MGITVEISYYPLIAEYINVVEDFINAIEADEKIKGQAGIMSTFISGDYDDVMMLLNREVKIFMDRYPSVFVIKISNACDV
ncbi:MAG: thiamine-binding protein [Bacteroidales bacterium]|nr:thiamine-binding protein [Bacteroidales bacterium]MBN2699558.1 thiamine-binding protein [Bacteroidales bacterium]